MTKRFWPAGLSLATILAELLPWGVKMQFMSPPGEDPVVTTTSYFDLLPFGYANFAPLITAILTCVLTALTILSAIKENSKLIRIAAYLALAATVISVCPIFMGAYTLIGGLISVLLLVQTIWLFRMKK